MIPSERSSVTLLTMVTLLLMSPMFASAQDSGRRVAVIAGVQRYDHSRLEDLRYAEKDAADLAERLRGAGFDVILLSTAAEPNSPDRPTFARLDAEVKRILSKISKRDLVLIAMSGHGIQFEDSDENFFCPEDANPLTKERCYSLKRLVNDLDASGAGTKLLLVDACRDQPKLPRGSKGAAGSGVRELPQGVAALFSCAANEVSWETDKAGGGHGVFFHAVLEALDGEAANKAGQVTWSRLVAHVKESVPERVSDWIGSGILQRPHEVANLASTPVLVRLSRPAEKSTVMNRPSPPPKPPSDGSQAKSITSKTTGMELVLIPAGRFLMGSPASEEGRDDDETQHEVTLTESFYLGKTEVTKGQWKRVMGTEPWKGKIYVKEGDDYAATHVSWEDAVEYCKRLSDKDGRAYRLPTEAEWEYACRAGSRTKWHFGDSEDELGEYAWYDGNAYSVGEEYAHRVGQKKSNGFGLYDMHGNVWEWCHDWHGAYPSGRVTDPTGPSEGSLRVYRGGSWSIAPVLARSAIRYGLVPSYRFDFLGFRVASSSVE